MEFVNKIFGEAGKATSPARLTLIFLLPFGIALIILFVGLIKWEEQKINEDQISGLREVARSFFEQIMITRIWNARHGGVYVETSSDTPSNPYLEDQERDIVSIKGKHYTKVNPAYMTRQLSEIAALKQGYKFHIVSLKPVNPYNTPDEWERESLSQFEKKGATDAAVIYREPDGTRFFKYIAPIKVEDSCLKCHAKHGYSHGDIRGGIDIIIPMENSDRIHSMKVRRITVYLLVIGAVSLLFMGVITFVLSRRLAFGIEKNIEHKKLEAAIEIAGATAHEMRQPMTVIYNLIELLNYKVKDNEPVTEEEMEMIIGQCVRMNDIIKKMLHITSYKTMDYYEGKKIIDLNGSSKDSDRTGDG